MEPGQELIHQVRAGFIKQGTNLSAYCRDNSIDGGNVYRLLRGEWNGEKAKLLRAQIMTAAKVEMTISQSI